MVPADFLGVVRMTQTVTSRSSVGARHFGYVVGALVNVGLLWLANIWPGWEAVPFLTAETILVLGLVNASIVSNIVANAVYLVSDPPWLQALGTLSPPASDCWPSYGSGRSSPSPSAQVQSTGRWLFESC